MSGEVAGVQGIIRQHTPLAAYFHCTSQSLIFLLAHSCKPIGIRNMIDKQQKLVSSSTTVPNEKPSNMFPVVAKQLFDM